MRVFKLVGLAAFTIVVMVSSVWGQFYYSGGQAIPLTIDSSKMALKFQPFFPPDSQEALLAAVDRIVGIIGDSSYMHGFIACSLSSGIDYYAFLDSLDTITGIYASEPYYMAEDSSSLLVGESFCVGFQSNVSQDQIDSINVIFNVLITGQSEVRPNAFYLKRTDSSDYRLLELANAYYNLPETRYSHPNFMVTVKKDSYTLYDYYHPYQWHIKKVVGSFNNASVWDFVGLERSIRVAVIDNGVWPHEDLPNERVLPGLDLDWDTPTDFQWHGMACAGIIAASHTVDSLEGQSPNSGVISMNPYVDVVPVRIPLGSECVAPESLYVWAVEFAYSNSPYAGRAHVLSCSWSTYPYWDELADALEHATHDGRFGLGCPVIFSSGNTKLFPEGVNFPARLPYCFAVGAIDTNDYRWGYSRYDSTLDMVAPSGYYSLATGDVWTIDQMGWRGGNSAYMSTCPPGNNDNGYICKFGGTSAACAVVAGVASLILAKDSTLTVDEVYDILKYSAQTELMYDTISPPDVELGYGRVDAFRAILSISRGDADNDGSINVGDITYLQDYLFFSGPETFPSPLLGDVDCDGAVNVGDPTHLSDYLFFDGPPPVNPCFEF